MGAVYVGKQHVHTGHATRDCPKGWVGWYVPAGTDIRPFLPFAGAGREAELAKIGAHSKATMEAQACAPEDPGWEAAAAAAANDAEAKMAG